MSSRRIVLIDVIGVLLFIIVAEVLAYYSLSVLKIAPVSYTSLIEAGITILVGYIAITIIAKTIGDFVTRISGPRKGNTASVTFRYVGYIVLALVVLSILGVSGTALLAGGTFAGLVVGLAGQTVLSNLFAGILLLVARPFEIGERVTLATTQYSFSVPAYSPKFYSVEKFVLGFTGTIEDITFNYSIIRLDEGAVVKIPNNIMIQAAVVSHPHTETIVRVRYEAKMTKDLEFLLNKVKEAVQNNQWVANREKIEVNVEAITQNTVLLLIDAPCKGENETKARSSLLLSVHKVVSQLD
ncbi:hypothetical protein B9Q02_09900 [Candidatus Marsarchaeota G1 archaeon BE_D]|jgi:Small-conductance mechanosensitive channel|uniref:Mechanosensitive ion channel MscS domain-containing protein n=1 Tax=Candidatus Marsarchaeota G1 archaeon BE_D TaxID=1978156 RepID=A0A2R6ACM4_9ARCH|nr:MAG: hypothetical protein B9Q02_09900 [Candidatus Marsarchaeota G1 archaeon BE_D]